jgi:competence protein ComEA
MVCPHNSVYRSLRHPAILLCIAPVMDTLPRAEHSSSPPPRPLLRVAEQATIAVLLVLSLAVIAITLAVQHAQHGGVIDIDDAPPVTLRFQVDINQADWPELMQLPNIGEELSRRIVESRERDGRFTAHEDLRRVRGIGPKTLESIRPYLLPIAPDTQAESND